MDERQVNENKQKLKIGVLIIKSKQIKIIFLVIMKEPLVWFY